MNYLEEEGKPKLTNGQLVYENKTNFLFGEMMLWTRTNVGTRQLIEADWPGARKVQARTD
jgi:hypothetical protein